MNFESLVGQINQVQDVLQAQAAHTILRLSTAKLQSPEEKEGLSQNLFVSKYRLQLPSEEEMRQYLIESATEADWEEYRKEQANIENK